MRNVNLPRGKISNEGRRPERVTDTHRWNMLYLIYFSMRFIPSIVIVLQEIAIKFQPVFLYRDWLLAEGSKYQPRFICTI